MPLSIKNALFDRLHARAALRRNQVAPRGNAPPRRSATSGADPLTHTQTSQTKDTADTDTESQTQTQHRSGTLFLNVEAIGT